MSGAAEDSVGRFGYDVNRVGANRTYSDVPLDHDLQEGARVDDDLYQSVKLPAGPVVPRGSQRQWQEIVYTV